MRRLDALRLAAGAAAEALAPEGGEASAGTQLLAGALARLDALAGVDPALDTLAERMTALLIESQDLAGGLRDDCERAGAQDLEGSLAQAGGYASACDGLEERLAAIERLARKHGGSIGAVLEHAARARARATNSSTGRSSELELISEQLEQAREELERECSRCVAPARPARRPLRSRCASSSPRWRWGRASFEVILGEREPSASGADSAEFMLAPNPGVPAGPLREVASGGELSRVMLAIMTVAHASSLDATLVFDEVDAGIGGHTARAVGARLRELGERRQVLCITHLPQIPRLARRSPFRRRQGHRRRADTRRRRATRRGRGRQRASAHARSRAR